MSPSSGLLLPGRNLLGTSRAVHASGQVLDRQAPAGLVCKYLVLGRRDWRGARPGKKQNSRRRLKRQGRDAAARIERADCPHVRGESKGGGFGASAGQIWCRSEMSCYSLVGKSESSAISSRQRPVGVGKGTSRYKYRERWRWSLARETSSASRYT